MMLPSAATARAMSAQPVNVKTADGKLLAGTLDYPSGAGPFPVILIIAGSGPVDRNGNSSKGGLDSNCYKLLAERLASHGIASVRYDKRGVGESTLIGSDERTLRFSTFIEDAVAWGRKLQRDRRFSTLTILGHSEGSLAGMVAARQVPADGFVSIAGPGEPLSKLTLKQLERQLPPNVYKDAQAIVANLERGVPVNDVPALLEPVLRPSVQPYVISLFQYDPAQEIAKLKMPVLIVQGERDLQVDASDARSLAQSSPEARLVMLPKMNHIFKDVGSVDDNVAAYSDPSREIDPKLACTIGSFVSRLRKEVRHA